MSESSRSGRTTLRFPAPLPKGGELEFIDQVTVSIFFWHLWVLCIRYISKAGGMLLHHRQPPSPLPPSSLLSLPRSSLSSVSPAIESTPSVCLVGGVCCKGRQWLL